MWLRKEKRFRIQMRRPHDWSFSAGRPIGRPSARGGSLGSMPISMRGSPQPSIRRPPSAESSGRHALFTNDVDYRSRSPSLSPNMRPPKSASLAPLYQPDAIRHTPPPASRPPRAPTPASYSTSSSNGRASPGFVRVLMPGSQHDKQSGIQIAPEDVTWSVAPPPPGHALVMLESLETIPVPLDRLQPVASLHDHVERPPEMIAFHGCTEDGSRKDRTWTAKHGGGLTAVASGHDDHAKHASSGFASLNASLRFASLSSRSYSHGGSSTRRSSISGGGPGGGGGGTSRRSSIASARSALNGGGGSARK